MGVDVRDPLTPEQEEFIARKKSKVQWNPRTRLNEDALNILGAIGLARMVPEKLAAMQPLPTYARYLEYKDDLESEVMGFDASIRDYIIQQSDPANVAKFDAMIAAFNADLPDIKEKKNFAALEKFDKELRALVHGQ